MLMQRGTNTGSVTSSCTTQQPPGVVTHMPRPEEAAGHRPDPPLTKRTFLTTSRSLGYHSKSIAKRRKAEAKGGTGQGKRSKVSKQELEKRKPWGQTGQCKKRLREGSKNNENLCFQGYEVQKAC